jgi:L-threonylcarbamoyladenylate synthase
MLVSDDQAAELLRSGEILAFPTETLYGFACDPCNSAAVAKLCKLKDRPPESGIPLIAASVERILPVLGRAHLARDQSNEAQCRSLVREFWPGPLTLVLDVDSETVDIEKSLAFEIFGPEQSVAVRVSESVVAQKLAELSPNKVITATSANRRGAPAATSEEQVSRSFPEISIYGGGSLALDALPSTILDVRRLPFSILREGAICRDELTPFLD